MTTCKLQQVQQLRDNGLNDHCDSDEVACQRIPVRAEVGQLIAAAHPPHVVQPSTHHHNAGVKRLCRKHFPHDALLLAGDRVVSLAPC